MQFRFLHGACIWLADCNLFGFTDPNLLWPWVDWMMHWLQNLKLFGRMRASNQREPLTMVHHLGASSYEKHVVIAD